MSGVTKHSMIMPKLVTPHTMRACYDFLRVVAFEGCKLPKSVRFVAKPLRDKHGLYEYPPHVISLDTGIRSLVKMMQVMAHEMCHVALEKTGYCDHDKHDHHFKALANIICAEMGWPRGSV